MDSYRRVFGAGAGGGYPATSVPTISTGVPLSARFKQIQLSHSQSPYVQRPAVGNANYYSSSSEFQGGLRQAYQGSTSSAQSMRNRMLSRQLEQRRAALELQQLRALTGASRFSPLRRKLPVQNRIGQRGGRLLRAAVLHNQMASVMPMNMATVAGGLVQRFGRGISQTRGRVAMNRVQKTAGVGLVGRVGVGGSGIGTRRGNTISTRGVRGRNIISTRSGRGGSDLSGRSGGSGQKVEAPTREDLDSELDTYMRHSKFGLDKELDDYMAKARSAATTTINTNPALSEVSEVVTMEA